MPEPIDPPDFLQLLGVSALGSRLRRLFEALNGAVTELYRAELGFEQRWFSLTLLLAKNSPASVQACARGLKTSHAAILQTADAMERAGLLERRKDDGDRRVTLLSLTEAGRRKAEGIKPISAQVDRAAGALIAEAAPDFIASLTALENALRERPFAARLAEADASDQPQPRKQEP